MPNITKDHAELICKKLGAVDESLKGAAHERHCVYYGKVLLGHIGIRHGSKRNQSHDHVPKDLNVSPRFAWELGTCTKYLDDYLDNLRGRGHLPQEQEATEQPQISRPWEKDWVALQAATPPAPRLSEDGPIEGESSI
jgi:hypothetical protein